MFKRFLPILFFVFCLTMNFSWACQGCNDPSMAANSAQGLANTAFSWSVLFLLFFPATVLCGFGLWARSLLSGSNG